MAGNSTAAEEIPALPRTLKLEPKNMNNVLGSIGSPNFRIDVIFNSLRELQQEKERLQQHFNEEKARCKTLEMKLEVYQAKFLQSSERNCKMQETVNAAKQKVLQTQMQANRLKELNDIKGAKIEELRRKIDEEMEKEQMELQEFERHLGELTNNFRDARYYYTKENVNQEIEQWRKQAEAARAVVLKEENTLKELTAKFHQLEVENKEEKDKINNKLEFGLTIEELELAVNVCEGINEEKKGKLRLTEQQLGLELKRLEQAKSDGQRFAVSPLTTNEGKTTADEEIVSARSISTPFLPVQCNSHQDSSRQDSLHAAQGETVHQPRMQSEGKKTSLQGRSFFISLPVTPSKANN